MRLNCDGHTRTTIIRQWLQAYDGTFHRYGQRQATTLRYPNLTVFRLVGVHLCWMFLMLIMSPLSFAKNYAPDEVVFVAFPAANIKNDAFIVGKVKQRLDNGNYLLSVLDYVEGHDYGSSCVPMAKTEDPNATALGFEKGWEMWTDTTKLDTQNLDYIVPGQNVLPLGYGKQYFVERNNLYIVFGRWKSDAPVMTLDRIERAQNEAKNVGLKELVPVFELVKFHRRVFYDDNNRPFYAFERIEPAITMMREVERIFKEQPSLANLWFAKNRNWDEIGKNSYTYFMIDAIDKIREDAWDQLYEEGIERAGVDKVNELRALVDKIVKQR